MVRAIDLQQSLLQTSVAEKIQQIQQQHSDMQQRYYQLKLSEEDRLAQEKIKQFEEADKAKLRRKEENKEKRGGGNQNPLNNAELHSEENDESSEEGGHINITV